MKLKNFIYCFFIIIFAISCNEPIIPIDQITQEQTQENLLKATVLGKKYYVSKTGSNSNDGSFAKPFLTIQYAEDRLVTGRGDTVFVRSGTYNERVRIWGCAGTAGKPTVFINYNNESVTIDGKNIPLGMGTGLVYISHNYINLIGFNVINSTSIGIIVDGTSNHSLIKNCQVSKSWDTGIGSYAGTYNTIEDCIVSNTCMSNYNGALPDGQNWGAALTMRGNYALAKNNTIHDSWGEGLSISQADYIVVQGNTVYDSYSVNLYIMNSIGCVVENNRVYMTKVVYNLGYARGSSVGMGLWNESYVVGHDGRDNTIRYNVVYNTRRNFYAYGGMINTKIVYNTFVNSTHTAGNVQLNRDARDVNSIFKNNIIIQDNSYPCMLTTSLIGLIYGNNIYNKDYDIDAVGLNDIIADPKFISATDFRLQSTSPAINKGISIKGITKDYTGKQIVGIPDIGAYEF